jgi:hypothetical protein
MVSSSTALVIESKSEALTWPRLPPEVNLVFLMVTVVDGAGVEGGDFHLYDSGTGLGTAGVNNWRSQ